MPYNVHQLNQTVVIDWGPLSIYSTYVFEDFNLVLIRLFHGNAMGLPLVTTTSRSPLGKVSTCMPLGLVELHRCNYTS